MSFSLTVKTADERRAEATALQEAQIVACVQNHVEDQARSLGYASSATLVSYGDSTIPQWANEARAFSAWRDAVWKAVFARLDELKTQPALTLANILEVLPNWGEDGA